MTTTKDKKPYQTIYIEISFNSEADADNFLDEGYRSYVYSNDDTSLIVAINVTPQSSESWFNALNYDHRVINWEILYDMGDGEQFLPQ